MCTLGHVAYIYIYIYIYIYTEIYALKSYVVNFCTEKGSGQSEERTTFLRVRNIVPPIRGHDRCFFTAANFPPLMSFLDGRSLHSLIQRKDLFRRKLLLDQKEFFRTESDIKIRKMEENRFANFSISVED